MLPITCLVFTGCKDKYNVKGFYNTYKSIADSCSTLTLVEASNPYGIEQTSHKIDINYSEFSTLSSLVEDPTSKYHNLKYFYQQLLDDSLAPVYFFGEKISSSNNVSKKQAEQLTKKMDDLKEDYEDIDYYLGSLITSLKTTNDQTINLAYLKKVFTQYEKTIYTAGSLSAIVNDVYFNTITSNSSFNYSSKSYFELTDADLTTISLNVRSRMYYYKSVYANVYTHLHLRGTDLASKLIYDSYSIPEYAPYEYIAEIQSLNTLPTESLRANQKDIYNHTISLYNIQASFDKAYALFNSATSNVTYLNINPSTASQDELSHKATIEQFASGIVVDSYEILTRLVDLLYL